MESYIQFFLFDALTLQKKMGFLPLFFSFGDLVLFYFFFVLLSGYCLHIRTLALASTATSCSLLGNLLRGLLWCRCRCRRCLLCCLGLLSGRLLSRRRRRRLLCRLLGSRLLGLALWSHIGEGLLENGLIGQRLIVAVADLLEMRAESEACLANCSLGVCMLLIGQKLADARRVLNPGRRLADLLLLTVCGSGLCLANLLA